MEEHGDGRNRRLTAGKGVDLLEMSFGGGNYTSRTKVYKQFIMKTKQINK